MKCTHLLVLALLTFALALPARAGDNPEYTVKLNRPCKAGDKFDLKAGVTYKGRSSTTISGREKVQTDEFVAQFDGTMEVLSVNKIGRITKAEFTTRACTITRGTETTDVLIRNMVVLAERDAQTHKKNIRPKEKWIQVSEDGQRVLDLLLDVDPENRCDSDAALGTDSPKKVGKSWKINRELVARELAETIPVQTGNVSGSTKFCGVKTVNGVECLNVSSDIQVEDIPQQLPPTIKVKSATLSLTLGGAFPVDPSLYLMEKDENSKFDVVAKGKTADGQPAEMHDTIVVAIKKEFTPKK